VGVMAVVWPGGGGRVSLSAWFGFLTNAARHMPCAKLGRTGGRRPDPDRFPSPLSGDAALRKGVGKRRDPPICLSRLEVA